MRNEVSFLALLTRLPRRKGGRYQENHLRREESCGQGRRPVPPSAASNEQLVRNRMLPSDQVQTVKALLKETGRGEEILAAVEPEARRRLGF